MPTRDELEQRRSSLSPARQELLNRRLYGKQRSSHGMEIVSDPSTTAPLSFAQQRLWFLEQLYPGNPAYNLPIALNVRGNLDRAALEKSINAIIERHSVLRTSVVVNADGQPAQLVHPEAALKLALIDLQSLRAEDRQAAALRAVSAEAAAPFDLARPPLVRVCLLQTEAEEAILLITMHHIVFDDWSRDIFVEELSAAYGAYRAGRNPTLAPLPIQYADFARWQRQRMQGTVLDQQLRYWKQQLSGVKPFLDFPTDAPRPAQRAFEARREEIVLDGRLLNAVKAWGSREGATLFIALFTVFNIVLHCYSRQETILVGTPIANRNRPETQRLIGFFINTLVMRTNLGGDPSFGGLVRAVKEQMLQASEHQDLPFEKLVEELQPERIQGYSPFFQVWFVLGSDPVNQAALPGVRITRLEHDDGVARQDLDLHLAAIENDDGMLLELTYNKQLFNQATIRRVLGYFKDFLETALDNPAVPLSQLRERFIRAEKEYKHMKEQDLAAANLRKFREPRRSATRISEQALVKAGYLNPESTLPLVIEPAMPDLELGDWAEKNRAYVDQELLKHGAILFRNFRNASIAGFEQLTERLFPDLLDYHERSTPRHAVKGKIYTSTEYPADQWIPMHNEHSYAHSWPRKILFYCPRPAAQGGETPIADSQRVYQLLPAHIRERFERLQVRYVRNYGDALDLSWREVFQTSDPAEVEDYCRRAGITVEWRGGDKLRTTQIRPAVVAHPETGEPLWFNQAHLFHLSSLAPDVQRSLLALMKEEDLPRNTYFGDGSPIEADVLAEIRRAYQQAMAIFPWQEGDILLLDNMRVAHGRAPFAGERKVVVAMAEAYELAG